MKANARNLHSVLAAAFAIVFSMSALAQQSTRASVDDASVRAARPTLGLSSSTPALTPGVAQGLNRSTSRPTARQRTPLTEADLLSGMNLSDQQKAAIDRIHHDMWAKMEIVSKDQNESPEQKAAMLEGMNRMQLRQVFDVLSSEQREEVRKRISAMRAAEHQADKTPAQRNSR